MRGRTITIFLVDGSPSGIRTAQESGWTGKAIQSPRTKLVDIKNNRDEITKPGVYILLGPDPNNLGESMAYIGEGDSIWPRIEAHNKDKTKDFWTEFVAFISKDKNLTKSHTRYLEARMINEAKRNKKLRILNDTNPDVPPLPEEDKESTEDFFDHMKLLLSALGVRIFETPAPAKGKEIQGFRLSTRGASAIGYITEDGFMVKKGSTAVTEDNPSFQKAYREQKRRLIANQQLVKKSDKLYEFQENVSFSSSSTAASIVAGQPMSGPQSWKTDSDKTYKKYMEDLINQQSLVAGKNTNTDSEKNQEEDARF